VVRLERAFAIVLLSLLCKLTPFQRINAMQQYKFIANQKREHEVTVRRHGVAWTEMEIENLIFTNKVFDEDFSMFKAASPGKFEYIRRVLQRAILEPFLWNSEQVSSCYILLVCVLPPE
jgi:hypothetical protein